MELKELCKIIDTGGVCLSIWAMPVVIRWINEKYRAFEPWWPQNLEAAQRYQRWDHFIADLAQVERWDYIDLTKEKTRPPEDIDTIDVFTKKMLAKLHAADNFVKQKIHLIRSLSPQAESKVQGDW